MIVRDVVCRKQAEIEVFPARAQLYFADERWIDPINTQLRFDAVLYNADTGVTWQVLAPDGGPGAGSIDASGLYRAPAKQALASGSTDLVTATANADPLRKAFAWVTLVGQGPLPAPAPQIEIAPQRATLYYQSGEDNPYISDSNKLVLLRAMLYDSPDPSVRWRVDGAVQPGSDPWLLYVAPASGGTAIVTVTAEIGSLPAIVATTKIVLLNYFWPGL